MALSRGNWAGNFTYNAARFHEPASVDHIVEVVKSSQNVRTLGTRHSFNAIADTPADLISLGELNGILHIDSQRKTVTIEAGVRYGELGEYLHTHGFALHNLASLPHIAVAGACATATHGSGVGNGNLATAVSAMEMVTADGRVASVLRQTHGEQFNGMVVHLGALGVITKLTLDIIPTFDIRQTVFENLPTTELRRNLDGILGCAYSVSLFTDWKPGVVNQIWTKHRATNTLSSPTLFSATPATVDRHPIGGISAENCTPQMNMPGPWHERLPHFKLNFTPSSGAELQSEYFVSRDRAMDAFDAVSLLSDRITPLLLISEIRTIASDGLWMSPCYQQDCVAFHFTWQPDWPAVKTLLPLIEQALAPFNARPHWGKLFTLSPTELRSRYGRLNDFRKLCDEFDPAGKFRNPFLLTNLFDSL